eukprot:gnl/MRDRNA2_/MRDRNA2_81772_c0_seq1.p1 gnl/MRDRNA2_/MRDRNA2_81772_c0~~gnl/MRDRNA2_/MRDRNA2_81772_c0_seq1.p1  ORF type:complete len:167 (-),score=30.31 gnl/MRDRNA2_/MRDRNA2_81772_c0_seq1:223-723(-)
MSASGELLIDESQYQILTLSQIQTNVEAQERLQEETDGADVMSILTENSDVLRPDVHSGLSRQSSLSIQTEISEVISEALVPATSCTAVSMPVSASETNNDVNRGDQSSTSKGSSLPGILLAAVGFIGVTIGTIILSQGTSDNRSTRRSSSLRGSRKGLATIDEDD